MYAPRDRVQGLSGTSLTVILIAVKILHISTPDNGGGASRSAYRLPDEALVALRMTLSRRYRSLRFRF
jgi:hypothetical protein